MSEVDHGTDGRSCGRDLAAYALGALDPAEAESVRAHLETCVVCPDELEAFEQVVGALPMSAPQYAAPRSLRRRVLRAVASEPVTAPRPRARRRFGLAGRVRFRPAIALGVALAAVALLGAGLKLRTSGSPSTREFAAQVIATPGSARISVTDGRAELILDHFSPPPAGEIYEVWLTRPGRPPEPTTALFSVTAAGDGDVEIPGSLRGIVGMMVTPEPAGGTRVPTHPAVIRAQLG